MESSGAGKITLVGAGNVASHLAPALDRVGQVVSVFSRNKKNAEQITAKLHNARATDSLAEIDTDVDYIIIAVSDNAVSDIVDSLPATDAVVAHTSGSIALQSRPGMLSGVFYPLQTFSKGKDVCLHEIPFFIEGSCQEAESSLISLAKRLSGKVYKADSSKRAVLHIAAVFACNFVNQLWAEADDILRMAGYDLNVFGPLLAETLDKAIEKGPGLSQTGPAMRGDTNVIESHMQQLNDSRREIYQLLTKRIIESHRVKLQ